MGRVCEIPLTVNERLDLAAAHLIAGRFTPSANRTAGFRGLTAGLAGERRPAAAPPRGLQSVSGLHIPHPAAGAATGEAKQGRLVR